MADPNREMLKLAVERLGPLTDELVFVGGCITGLFITDTGAAEVRPTKDVDTIVAAATYSQYNDFADLLRDAGFHNDAGTDAPIYRWIKEDTILDVMPLNKGILGFTNIWYRAAVNAAELYEIAEGVTIKVVTSPYFCATKIEAFKGRGNNDFFASHDLEDLIAVIDGRIELLDELRGAPNDVKKYIAQHVTELLVTSAFHDALPGHLGSEADRIDILLERLKAISQL